MVEFYRSRELESCCAYQQIERGSNPILVAITGSGVTTTNYLDASISNFYRVRLVL